MITSGVVFTRSVITKIRNEQPTTLIVGRCSMQKYISVKRHKEMGDQSSSVEATEISKKMNKFPSLLLYRQRNRI